MTYLIAFGPKPKPDFLPTLRQLASNDGVTIAAAKLTEGPGCYNLGLDLGGDNEAFIGALTFALMPAKWCVTTEQIPAGTFVDEVRR